jgi:hypothetical protein
MPPRIEGAGSSKSRRSIKYPERSIFMYRQGDILLVPITDLPKDIIPVDRDPQRGVVLAYGEHTGHAHALVDDKVALYTVAKGQTGSILGVSRGPSYLRHEEHGTVTLPAGFYRVIRQREYVPNGQRDVND